MKKNKFILFTIMIAMTLLILNVKAEEYYNVLYEYYGEYFDCNEDGTCYECELDLGELGTTVYQLDTSNLGKSKQIIKDYYGLEDNDEILNYVHAFKVDDKEHTLNSVGCYKVEYNPESKQYEQGEEVTRDITINFKDLVSNKEMYLSYEDNDIDNINSINHMYDKYRMFVLDYDLNRITYIHDFNIRNEYASDEIAPYDPYYIAFMPIKAITMTNPDNTWTLSVDDVNKGNFSDLTSVLNYINTNNIDKTKKIVFSLNNDSVEELGEGALNLF